MTEQEINLLDYTRVIWKWRKHILGFTCMTIIFTVTVSLFMPWTYTAETSILIPQQQRNMDTIASYFSSSTAGMPIDINQGTPGRTGTYKDILKSYTLAENVVEGLDLNREFPNIRDKEALVKKIMGSIRVKDDKKIMKFYASARSPKLAADIANYYMIALDEFNKRGNLQMATRVSEFLRRKVGEARADMDIAEEKLKKFEKEGHLVKLSDKELKLADLMRDAKIKGEVYSMLLQEYERSKIDQKKEELFFEVLDPARAPRGPSSPRMKLYIMFAVAAGLMFGSFMAFLIEYLDKIGVKVEVPDPDRKVDIKLWPIS